MTKALKNPEAEAVNALAVEQSAPREPEVSEPPSDAAVEQSAPREPEVSEPPSDATELSGKATLKLRSAYGPYRRAGVTFSSPGSEIEVEIERTPEYARRVIAWFNDPAIQIWVQVGEAFEKLTELPKELLEMADTTPLQEPAA